MIPRGEDAVKKSHDIAGWHRTLDLEPGASLDEIKAAWRDLVQVWHPDRFGGNERLRLKAEEALKRINEAYERLRDLDSRSAASPPAAEGVYEPETHGRRPPEKTAEEILAEGVQAWNLWRKKRSDIAPRLKHANLVNARLSEIDFRETALEDANLQGADLYKANLSYARMKRARLFGADLHRAILLETDLREAELSEADLSSADLRGAKLVGARFFGANLTGARLDGADLSAATGFTRKQLALVSIDADTRLPAGV